MSTAAFKDMVSHALAEIGIGKADGLLTPLELAAFAQFVEDQKNLVPLAEGTVSVEDRFGGEGFGDTYYIVFKVETLEGEIHYYRMDGTYNEATDEVDWDGAILREVQKTERVVYLYE